MCPVRIINALMEIKGTLYSHSKSLSELRDGQNRIEGKIYGLEDDITGMKTDIVEIKTTVNAYPPVYWMRRRKSKS